MNWKLITPPAGLVLDSAALADRIGATVGDNTVLLSIEALIRSAGLWVESYTGRALRTQTRELALDAWPCDPIELPGTPVQSITSITYTDPDGADQTLSLSAVQLDSYAYAHRVALAYGASWPSTRAQMNAIRIRYVCGYGNADAGPEDNPLPADIQHAIVLIVSQAYRSQSGLESGLYPTSIPNAARDLLAPYRMMAF